MIMEPTREEILINRNADFLHTFAGPHGEKVLEYLSKFCLENSSTYVEDSRTKGYFNEGARSVILEIRRWLNLDISKFNKE